MSPNGYVRLAALSTCALIGLAPMTTVVQAQAPAPSVAQGSGNSTMPQADQDMQRVLAKLQELGAKPIGTLSPQETRQGPSPADAVKALVRDQGRDPAAMMAQMGVGKRDMEYPTAGGTQPIRIYTPEGAGPGPLPVIVYYHGGGWVIADLDTYEASAMALANKAQAIVASVEYRHAPEHKFPAAHEDANAAYRWVVENAHRFNGDADRVALAGESAGGNLALNVAITARDQRLRRPAHMLLVYPVAGTEFDTDSYQANAEAMPLNRQAMQWFFNNTVAKPEDLQDPRLDLVGRANLRDLPPATVITAEIDPLLSEGRTLADKLRAAGVETTYQNFEGVTHEFFGMAPVVADAEQAQELAARELREALGTSAGVPAGAASGSTR